MSLWGLKLFTLQIDISKTLELRTSNGFPPLVIDSC